MTEKRKADARSSLVESLRIVQDEFDVAVTRLGAVESKVVEGTARIEASERRVEKMRKSIDASGVRTEEDVAYRIAFFRKYEDGFLAREERFRSHLGY